MVYLFLQRGEVRFGVSWFLPVFLQSESHNTRFIIAQENAHFYFDTFYTIHIIFHRENATALRLNYSLIVGTRG